MLARYMPGLGDPMRIPIDLFDAYMRHLIDILGRENGGSDPRSHVERELARAMNA